MGGFEQRPKPEFELRHLIELRSGGRYCLLKLLKQCLGDIEEVNRGSVVG